ncbi:MAG TPA: phosphatidate cytidylyltransferase [Pseudolabrys sp.]|nr:phosphatidate cytidylyltransferase [Pseudolabrys sp.]
MSGTDPAHEAAPLRVQDRYNLLFRVLSAIVLAPTAIITAFFGGWIFAIFWGIAAIATLWEWTTLVAGATARVTFYVGAGALALAVLIAGRDRPGVAMMIVVLGALAAIVFARAERRIWIAAGVCYAAVMFIAPVILRMDDELGLTAILMLFVVVWATDVFGYFVGRAVGGPKLAPRVSPKKTWSGAIGGTAGAVILAVILIKLVWPPAAPLPVLPAVGAVALLLSLVAQAGDIFESALKRHFGAKDSSQLIPGHGGFMDRLDGFWAASLLAALAGLARGGFDAPAHGLLLW